MLWGGPLGVGGCVCGTCGFVVLCGDGFRYFAGCEVYMDTENSGGLGLQVCVGLEYWWFEDVCLCWFCSQRFGLRGFKI